MKDWGAQPEPGVLTRIASYIALLLFCAVLGGTFFSLRQCRNEGRRELIFGDPNAHLSEREKYELGKQKSHDWFITGSAIGGGIGVLFLIGYHVQHGTSHLREPKQ